MAKKASPAPVTAALAITTTDDGISQRNMESHTAPDLITPCRGTFVDASPAPTTAFRNHGCAFQEGGVDILGKWGSQSAAKHKSPGQSTSSHTPTARRMGVFIGRTLGTTLGGTRPPMAPVLRGKPIGRTDRAAVGWPTDAVALGVTGDTREDFTGRSRRFNLLARRVSSVLRPRFALSNAATAVIASRRKTRTDALPSRLWVLAATAAATSRR